MKQEESSRRSGDYWMAQAFAVALSQNPEAVASLRRMLRPDYTFALRLQADASRLVRVAEAGGQIGLQDLKALTSAIERFLDQKTTG